MPQALDEDKEELKGAERGKGKCTSFGRDNSVIYETPGLLMEISLKNELRRPPWRHHLDKTTFRGQTQEKCSHLFPRIPDFSFPGGKLRHALV